MKKLLKSTILLATVFASLLFINCEEENSNINENSKMVINTSHLDKNDLSLKPIVSRCIDKLNNKNLANRNEENDDLNFLVNQNRALVLSSEHFTTYVFNIIRDEFIDENLLENYVLTVYSDETYNQLLIKYPKLGDGTYNVFDSEVIIITDDLLTSRVDCDVDEVISTAWDENVNCVNLPCGSYQHWGQAEAHDCEASTKPSTFCNGGWVHFCSGSSSGSGGSPTGTGTISGGSGWTNTNDPDNNTVPSVPSVDIIGSLKKRLGYATGTPEGNWIDSNLQSYSISLFLDEYGDTPENIALAQSSIQNFLSYDDSNYPGKDLGYPYEWWMSNDFITNSGNFDMPSENANAPLEGPNAKEVFLFNLFPYAATLHVENSLTAKSKANQLVNTNVLTGIYLGKADAFRHAFWNALGTAEFGYDIMKLFADAHEWGEEPGRDVEMDLHNNHKGRNVGGNFNNSSSDSDISDAILVILFNGELRYISHFNLDGTINEIMPLTPTNQ